jgi:hypothetical protein
MIKVDDDRTWARLAERSRRDWTVVVRETEEYLREEFGFEVTSHELGEFEARHSAALSEPRGRATGSA